MPAAAAMRTPGVAGPFLNCDDIPEAGVGHRVCKHRALVTHGCFPTVFEEDDEGEDWQALAERQVQQETGKEPWSCGSCTFLNAAALHTCEVCDRSRTFPPALRDGASATPGPPTCWNPVENVVVDPKPFLCGQKWPSLRQAAEKSWDLCEQSSIASSMVDVAKIADLEESWQPFQQPCMTSSTVDVAKMADLEAENNFDNVSIASSWLDVGSVANINAASEPIFCVETSSMSSWLEISESTDIVETMEITSSEDLGACSSPKQGECVASNIPIGGTRWSSVVSAVGTRAKLNTPNRAGVVVPPLVRRPVLPKAKVDAAGPDGELFDDQDGRGCARANRRYRKRR